MECSIIVPYFSRKKLLINSLISLGRQKCSTDFEIIVIDDGSEDLVEDEIRNLHLPVDIKYFKYARGDHSCAAFARNRGFENSAGDVIICLDCDQIVSSTFIESHCKPFQEAGGAEILQIGTRNFLKEFDSYDLDIIESYIERRDSRHRLFSTYSNNMAQMRGAWHLVFSNNISFLRSSIEKHGFFDERFKGWGLEDTEFGYRLAKNGVKIVYNPNVEVHHQFHPSQHPKNTQYQQWMKNLSYFIEKHNDLPVMLQHIFADHFDQNKKNALLSIGVKNTWDYCYDRFENALRNLCITPTLDCFASLAMTVLVESIDFPAQSLRGSKRRNNSEKGLCRVSLRAIYEHRQKRHDSRCLVLDDPSIEHIKSLVERDEADSLVVFCSKNNVKLWMWVQCQTHEYARYFRLVIKESAA